MLIFCRFMVDMKTFTILISFWLQHNEYTGLLLKLMWSHKYILNIRILVNGVLEDINIFPAAPKGLY